MKHCRDRNTRILHAYILNSTDIGMHTLLYIHLKNLLCDNFVYYHHFVNQVLEKQTHITWEKIQLQDSERYAFYFSPFRTTSEQPSILIISRITFAIKKVFFPFSFLSSIIKRAFSIKETHALLRVSIPREEAT